MTWSIPSTRAIRAPTAAPDGGGGASSIRAGVDRGLDDLAIAGAAAQDATERIHDLGLGGVRPRREEGIGGHQHARRADPALRGAAPQERGLDRPQGVTGGEALDGVDRAPVQLTERDETGAHRVAVQANRAGATVAGIAADLRAGQTQVVAEDLAEAPHRVAIDRDITAIDPEGRRSGRHVGHASTCATARRTSVRAASRR